MHVVEHEPCTLVGDQKLALVGGVRSAEVVGLAIAKLVANGPTVVANDPKLT
jgi:hypothetical protein